MFQEGSDRVLYVYPRGWDRVNKSEVSAYDSTRGRLIYRLRNKDSND
uniref:Translational initiation factor 1 n=2 Tax=Sterculia TaxID=66667 RepID=A0A8K1Z9A5_9ROSI|nr:translational initiation factor 1 [Sterculia monosperma]QOJ45772.1 translational initiation factor 1 [Sterculia monosperma]UFK62824.1 translational initiation factor 1 [Sterculia nobilis]